MTAYLIDSLIVGKTGRSGDARTYCHLRWGRTDATHLSRACALLLRRAGHLAVRGCGSRSRRNETAVSVNQNGECDDGLRGLAVRFRPRSRFSEQDARDNVIHVTRVDTRDREIVGPVAYFSTQCAKTHRNQPDIHHIYVRPAGRPADTLLSLGPSSTHGVTSTRQISPRIIIYPDDAMTLHWWMHWFWVTAQFVVILGSPLPSTTSDPINQQAPQPSPRTPSPSLETESIYRSSKSPRLSFRIAKAIGLYPQTNTAVAADRQQSVTTVASSLLESRGSLGTTGHETVDESSFRGNISEVVPLGVTTPAQRILERLRNPTTKKESKITWILTTSKSSGRSKYDQEERYNQSSRNVSFDEVEDLTVLPLQENMTKVDLSIPNRTRSTPLASLSATGVAGNTAIRTFNRSEDEVELDEEVAQTQHFATAASILEVGVSESTRLSRARNTFTDFQRDQMQGDNRSSDYTDTDSGNQAEQQSSGTSAAGIAAITGSCLATVALLSTMGSLGFIIYRRKYLNPPQTLNSDKCSNPDSSGYIDDSTIRDNSEEMYSLDNDSFLNSLEAMTIQNYWTDSVKHTKL